jgi:aryl-alcohol dehydrogenase-like predicted oxidoreductase
MNEHIPTTDSPNRQQVDTVQLGRTNIQLSTVGIGTWAWGDKMFWGYGKGTYTDADLKAAFLASLDAGINWFDTAEVYGRGRSETLLGQFMAETGRSPLIATKFMPYPWRLNKGALHAALDRSLKRLGTATVTLYQIHWPIPIVPINTWMAALASAVKDGLVDAAGVSNYSVEQTQRALTALEAFGLHLASNQVEFSLLQRKPERSGLLQFCRENNITVLAYSPLGMGLLTGKYDPEHPPAGIRKWRFKKDRLARIQSLIALMREIGQGHAGKTPSQIALNWVICKGAIPIAGAKNARQAQDNAGAMNWRLSPEEVAALDSASDQFLAED